MKEQLAKATEQVKEGNLDSAITTLKEILQEQPDQEIALGLLAAIYLQIGMTEKAVEHFEALLETSPNNPLARFQLGMARLSQGEPETALKTWEPLLAEKDDFMAHFHSSLALFELKRYQEAHDCIIQASRNMPSSHPLYPQLLDLHSNLTNLLGNQHNG